MAVQTYIVNGGVDLSTLTFESGVGSDQVGTDRDNSNGSIRAPLYKGNVVGTGYNPAGSPAGLINPADLAGFSFSSAGWVLTDGTYQIGYACLDELSALRQWWSTTVTIDADASPNAFLIVGGGTGTTTTTSSTTTTTTGSTTTTTTASTTTTTSRGRPRPRLPVRGARRRPPKPRPSWAHSRRKGPARRPCPPRVRDWRSAGSPSC